MAANLTGRVFGVAGCFYMQPKQMAANLTGSVFGVVGCFYMQPTLNQVMT